MIKIDKACLVARAMQKLLDSALGSRKSHGAIGTNASKDLNDLLLFDQTSRANAGSFSATVSNFIQTSSVLRAYFFNDCATCPGLHPYRRVAAAT